MTFPCFYQKLKVVGVLSCQPSHHTTFISATLYPFCVRYYSSNIIVAMTIVFLVILRMKKDGLEILKGSSLGMANLHKNIVGSDIVGTFIFKILSTY